MVATLATGSEEIATNRRRLDTFRNRNLAWYGQAEVKTNNLYQSFAQFNFLDTDAAVSLADSALRIDDDISKLLVGPEASITWRNINSVSEAIDRELRGLRPRATETKGELTNLKQWIKEAGALQDESDLIFARLKKMINKLNWGEIQSDKEAFAGLLVEDLAEMEALIKQASAFEWIKPPVSSLGLEKYRRETEISINKVEDNIIELEAMVKNQTCLTDRIDSYRKALELSEQAKFLVEAGVPEIVSNQNKQQRIVATNSVLLAGFNKNYLKMMPAAYLSMEVAVCHETAILELSKAEALLATIETEYEKFSKIRVQSINLAQELRQIAAIILKDSFTPDECPLCHTQFKLGELSKHIKLGVDDHLESVGQKLLNQLRERKTAVHDATAIRAALDWLKEFSARKSLASDTTVNSAFAEVENAEQSIKESQRIIETLKKEIITLESRGLPLSRLEEILDRLNELGYPCKVVNREAIDLIINTIKHESEKSEKKLEDTRYRVDKLKIKLKSILDSEISSVKELKDEFSKRKERIAATESIQAKIAKFLSSFSWPMENPLAKLAVEAESVRKVAAEFKVTLAKERQAKSSYAKSIERKDLLEKRLEDLELRIKRFSEAQSTLEEIRKNYSLQSSMKSALQQNRAGIETIFLSIHSPADFQGLGSNWTTLVRKGSGGEASLNEISTGQRAAFALSIFLSQNSQLKIQAPPVILIDDPISHVDDLNSLSFLDYLREVVMMGGRQVFFSTANRKLAALFERKFDFLQNGGFRKFNLYRNNVD